jgi:hypothetical protein
MSGTDNVSKMSDESLSEMPADLTPEEIRQRVLEADKRVNKTFWDAATEQGIAPKVEEAFKNHEELYWFSTRDKVCVFIPLYLDEFKGLQKDNKFDDDNVARKCVVAGLENVVGAKARAGLFTALARRIMQVSDFESDMPDGVNPRVKR